MSPESDPRDRFPPPYPSNLDSRKKVPPQFFDFAKNTVIHCFNENRFIATSNFGEYK